MSNQKYAMFRLRSGDYLWLANDGMKLWRIATYTEDGSAIANDDKPLTGKFWGTWLYRRPVGERPRIDADDWSDWEMDECLLTTRRAALAAAKRGSERIQFPPTATTKTVIDTNDAEPNDTENSG